MASTVCKWIQAWRHTSSYRRRYGNRAGEPINRHALRMARGGLRQIGRLAIVLCVWLLAGLGQAGAVTLDSSVAVTDPETLSLL